MLVILSLSLCLQIAVGYAQLISTQR